MENSILFETEKHNKQYFVKVNISISLICRLSSWIVFNITV